MGQDIFIRKIEPLDREMLKCISEADGADYTLVCSWVEFVVPASVFA